MSLEFIEKLLDSQNYLFQSGKNPGPDVTTVVTLNGEEATGTVCKLREWDEGKLLQKQ